MQLRGALTRNGRLRRSGVYVIGGLGLLFFLLGIRPLMRALPLLITGQRSLAKVVEIGDTQPALRWRYPITVEFQKPGDEKPTRITFLRKDDDEMPGLDVGQIVRIAYNPADLTRLELIDVQSEWHGAALSVIVGIILLILIWFAPKEI